MEMGIKEKREERREKYKRWFLRHVHGSTKAEASEFASICMQMEKRMPKQVPEILGRLYS